MATARNLTQFSKNRLDSEPVPEDVAILLKKHSDFLEEFRIELNWKKQWAPWLDASYLSDEERVNPEIAANVLAIQEVCRAIAFIGAEEDGNYFGYWRGLKKQPIAKCPIVRLDNEGQFELLRGSTFAEAILVEKSYGEPERFSELRDWFQSNGVKITSKTLGDVTDPKEKEAPEDLLKKLYYRHLGKKPPA